MDKAFQQRRALLKALAALGAFGAVSAMMPAAARGATASVAPGHLGRVQGGRPRDVVFDAHIRKDTFQLGDRSGSAYSVNHVIPSPLIELWEGHTARLRVHNHLDQPTSLHWHGLLLPFQMDGVPGVAFEGVAPNTTFEAHFPVRQTGTYWYHSHSGMQEQKGLIGPLVVHPAGPDPYSADRDFVIVLNDWTFEDPHRIMAKLKAQSDYYNLDERTVGDFFDDVATKGWSTTLEERRMWGEMRMTPRDIADVTAMTYDYLLNGHASASPWEGLFAPGETVRLRFINASAMTYFNIRIPGLAMTVIEADGQPVSPVETDEFQIAVAETFDVLITPDARPYTLMCESMDRTGFAAGTLTPRLGARAPVPALRPPPRRTMADMNMAGMDMGDMDMDGAAMSGHDMAGKSLSEKSMSGKNAPSESHASSGHAMAGHGSMAHGAHDGRDKHSGESGHDGHAMAAGHGSESPGDIRVPATMDNRLDEPGTGLEGLDHRVLRYSELRRPVPIEDQRAPSRTIELHLTGNMTRYMWSFDGVAYSDSTPIDLVYGERVRLVLVNNTMMEHPIHLHGMFMALENDQGAHLPLKHTISVRPAARVSLLITADEPGRWAFHCHLLYHMDMGMFRVVRVLDKESAHA
ncbi:copper resistance system multicopper oxidase [Larsenimonas salina]|uniref:copper resistance system multicopper oxidase n=1 Tax=Larsenimonas salina TaxID=1295565 RepID=UPI002072DC33|nr:copper resistance system multicopper oxidase [Larsenimonas salina]MCM5705147.1 copper resistance system multicopper oxidase [Larsenimonas salina]